MDFKTNWSWLQTHGIGDISWNDQVVVNVVIVWWLVFYKDDDGVRFVLDQHA